MWSMIAARGAGRVLCAAHLRVPMLIGLALVLHGTLARAQFGSAPAELELVKVRDDVYVIFNEYVPGNVTALITEAGVLLIDDKYPIDFDNLMTELRKVTDAPVRYVINTHFHGDHSGGNALLQERGAQVVASENARIKMVEEDEKPTEVLTHDVLRTSRGRQGAGGRKIHSTCEYQNPLGVP